MISEIQISNFKAFGPKQFIPLRPITLVFGQNSAGKSSVIQSLLLARHIHDTGKPDAYQTTLGGATVDLGGFARYVYKQQTDRNTTISLVFKRADIPSDFHYLDDFRTLTLAYEIGMSDPNATRDTIIKSVSLFLDANELLRLATTNDGILQLDRDAFGTRSLFAELRLWSRLDTDEHLIAAKEMLAAYSGNFVEDASAIGLSVEGLLDPMSGKATLKGFLTLRRFIYRRHLESRLRKHMSAAAVKNRLDRQDDVERERAAVTNELAKLKILASKLVLKNLEPLQRENYDHRRAKATADLDRPDEDPLGFYRRLLSIESDDEAWPCALRYDIECLIEATSMAVGRELGNFFYLGPLRDIPPRHILETDEFDAAWVAGGGGAWQRLRKEPSVVEKVNQILRGTLQSRYTIQTQSFIRQLDDASIERCARMAIGKANEVPSATESGELVIPRFSADAPFSPGDTSAEKLAAILKAELNSRIPDEPLTEIQLFDSAAKIKVSHRDVGTGISQLLPVIVTAVASEGKLIAVEQPELHLHPALQAELGDVFIEFALGANKNTFLIETHSEHLILRLLRRIRETAETGSPLGGTAIHPEDVTVLYVNPGPEGSQVIELPVNTSGDFDTPWPDGFFAERAKELF